MQFGNSKTGRQAHSLMFFPYTTAPCGIVSVEKTFCSWCHVNVNPIPDFKFKEVFCFSADKAEAQRWQMMLLTLFDQMMWLGHLCWGVRISQPAVWLRVNVSFFYSRREFRKYSIENAPLTLSSCVTGLISTIYWWFWSLHDQARSFSWTPHSCIHLPLDISWWMFEWPQAVQT